MLLDWNFQFIKRKVFLPSGFTLCLLDGDPRGRWLKEGFLHYSKLLIVRYKTAKQLSFSTSQCQSSQRAPCRQKH